MDISTVPLFQKTAPLFVISATTNSFPDKLRSRETDGKLPSPYDVEGAAFGLSRLHSLYGVDTRKMVKEGVIESNLQRHQVGKKE